MNTTEETKRVVSLLPAMASTHTYTVGKVKFQVTSHFAGTCGIENKLAELMVEELLEKEEDCTGYKKKGVVL